MFKEWSLGMEESVIIQQLSDAYQCISQHFRNTGDTMEYLEWIAFLRFSLEKTADIMYNNISSSPQILCALLEKTKEICIGAGQSGIEYLARYLIKIIVKQHGLLTLKAISQMYPWVIPAKMNSQQVCIQVTSFFFLIYLFTFFKTLIK